MCRLGSSPFDSRAKGKGERQANKDVHEAVLDQEEGSERVGGALWSYELRDDELVDGCWGAGLAGGDRPERVND
jgi:hypothetical protein